MNTQLLFVVLLFVSKVLSSEPLSKVTTTTLKPFISSNATTSPEPEESSSIPFINQTISTSTSETSAPEIITTGTSMYLSGYEKTKMNKRQIPRKSIKTNKTMAEQYLNLLKSYKVLQSMFQSAGASCSTSLQEEWVTNFNKNGKKLEDYFISVDWRGNICNFFKYLDCVVVVLDENHLIIDENESTTDNIINGNETNDGNQTRVTRNDLNFESSTNNIDNQMTSTDNQFTTENSTESKLKLDGVCSCGSNSSIYALNLLPVILDNNEIVCYADRGELCGIVYFDEGTFPSQSYPINDWIPCQSEENFNAKCTTDDNGTSRCTLLDPNLSELLENNHAKKVSSVTITGVIIFTHLIYLLSVIILV